MEELWGSEIPRSSTTTLQTYILQLRRKVSQALSEDQESAKNIIKTSFSGYQINVAPRFSDVQRFEWLAAAGETEMANGNTLKASQSFSRALSLWRGSAFTDVPVGDILNLEQLRLEESRMHVLEQRIVADIKLGRHAKLIPELCKLVSQNPMHENLCAQFMIALYRSGVTWRALEAFQRLRKTLISELGVEPSARLQQLHQAILSGAPDLDISEPDDLDTLISPPQQSRVT